MSSKGKSFSIFFDKSHFVSKCKIDNFKQLAENTVYLY